MKKVLNWILILIIAGSAVFFTPTDVKAEDLSVSGIPSEVLVGKSFTVKVKVPANIGGRLYISYAKDNLKFKSGTDGVYGDNGLLNATVFFNSSEISVTFEALSVGTIDFSVYMEEAEYSDKDPSEGLPTIPKVTKIIKIVNETKSDDNSLSVLYLSQGYISPDFNPSTTTYKATVDYSVKSVRVTAKTTHAKASIASVTGNENLQVGENTISIVVKAESGATVTYKIIVTREAKKEDVSEKPGPSEDTEKPNNKIEGTDSGFDWGGKDLYFTEAVPDASLIKDFKQETVLIDNLNIPCFTHENKKLVLLNLKNDIDSGTLYVYDSANQYIYPFVKLVSNETYVIALQPDEDIETPEGYNPCTLSIEGKGTVTAYQYGVDAGSEFYLLYCLNNSGQYNWYQYDSAEKTFQRYIGIVPVEKPSDTEQPSDTEIGGEIGEFDEDNADISELKAKLKEEQDKNLKMICIFVFVLAVLLVVIFNLILSRQRTDDYLDEGDSDENDMEDEGFYEEESEEVESGAEETKETKSEEIISKINKSDDTESEESIQINIEEIINNEIIKNNEKIINDELSEISKEDVDDTTINDISAKLMEEAAKASEIIDDDDDFEFIDL